jgi:hypothetical protein
MNGPEVILIATFTVIGVTMLVQATTMDAVVRWARLPADTALEEEIALAEQTATEAGLAALSQRQPSSRFPTGSPHRSRRRTSSGCSSSRTRSTIVVRTRRRTACCAGMPSSKRS